MVSFCFSLVKYIKWEKWEHKKSVQITNAKFNHAIISFEHNNVKFNYVDIDFHYFGFGVCTLGTN